jgi:hypothetical protein
LAADLEQDPRQLPLVLDPLREAVVAREPTRHRPSLKPTFSIGFVDMVATVEKVPLCSWVDRDQRDQLLKLAIAGDRSLSAEVRRAVVEHLKSAARHPRRHGHEDRRRA